MNELDNDWYRVKLGILNCIAEASCWYEIDQANDALFHARLIFKRTKEVELRHQSEGATEEASHD